MDTMNKIIYLLDKNKKKQKELTDYLEIDKSTFTAWKNGKNKSYTKHLSKIAQFFGVSTDYLLGNEKKLSEKSESLDDVYFSLAKELQDKEIDPDDIRLAIETIKNLKYRKAGELS